MSEFYGVCDWCRKESNDLVEHRDIEEGLSGREYDVCKNCRKRENEKLDEQDSLFICAFQ